MWVKQCHKPPMTGNGKHTTYLYLFMVIWAWFMVLFYPHETYWESNFKAQGKILFPVMTIDDNEQRHSTGELTIHNHRFPLAI